MSTVTESATKHGLSFTEWIAKHGFDLILIFIVTGLLYTVGGMIVGYIVKKAVTGARQRTWHRKDIEKRQKTLVGLFTNLWRIMVIAIGVYWVLKTFLDAVSLAPLFASAGVVGVAIGFGSQALVKDLLSGVFIISENQYRVGDIIDINGDSGTVERIGTRSTVLRDADGNVHYFPNGTITHVINKTMGYSMARFSIAIQPSGDLDEVIAIINDTGKTLAGEQKWKAKIIDPPAFTSIGEFSGSSIILQVAGKTQPSDQWSVTAEMRRRLLTEFEAKDIALSGAAPPPAKK